MTHEFDGRKYEKVSSHQKKWGTKLIADLALKGSESVLDLGCGDGGITSQVAALLPEGEVLGIDASQGMIDVAMSKRQANLRFSRQDINNLDFESQFDVVFSNATLHWIKDHRRLLEIVRRALRPNGRLRFNFAGAGNCSHFNSVVKVAMGHDDFNSFFADFEWPWYMPSLDEYRILAEASDLQSVQVWGENADRYFPDENAMIGWIDQPSLVPFLAELPEHVKMPFRDFIVSRMIAETKQEDGRCFETFRRINISARK